MHLACKTRLTDRIWSSSGIQDEASDHSLGEQLPDAVQMVVHVASMPQLLVERQGRGKAGTLCRRQGRGNGDACKLGSVVFVDWSGEQRRSVAPEVHA